MNTLSKQYNEYNNTFSVFRLNSPCKQQLPAWDRSRCARCVSVPPLEKLISCSGMRGRRRSGICVGRCDCSARAATKRGHAQLTRLPRWNYISRQTDKLLGEAHSDPKFDTGSKMRPIKCISDARICFLSHEIVYTYNKMYFHYF